MKTALSISPVDMTPAVMQDLEDRGLILRLRPGGHILQPVEGETAVESLYESEPRHGGHKLIAVTVNRSRMTAFGTHPDNEEFLLLGDPATRPLYLVMALHRREALDEKVRSNRLTANDFIALRVRYNDPEVSFFTMLKDVPHDEMAQEGRGLAPSFYVTEPTAMGLEPTDLGGYTLELETENMPEPAI